MFHDAYLRGVDIIVFADCRLLYPNVKLISRKGHYLRPLPLFPLATNLSLHFGQEQAIKTLRKEL